MSRRDNAGTSMGRSGRPGPKAASVLAAVLAMGLGTAGAAGTRTPEVVPAPVYLWGAFRSCEADAAATQAIAQRIADMGERVLPLGKGQAGADCIGVTCAQRLRQTLGISTGRVLGAQSVEEGGGQSRVRVWLADLATLQQETFVDFPCHGCDLNAELSSHAALLVERSADPLVVGKAADVCTSSPASAAATPNTAPAESPRDMRIALSTYSMGGPRANVAGATTALRRALKDMGYTVVPIRGAVAPLDPRAALPQALRGLPFLDVAFAAADGGKELTKVHIRLTRPGESMQSVVDCKDTPCEDVRLPGRVLATATQLLDASMERGPVVAVQQTQQACARWTPPACGVVVAQNGPPMAGGGGDDSAQPSSAEGALRDPAAGSQPPPGASLPARPSNCSVPPLSSYRRWQAGWALVGIGAAVLVPSVSVHIYEHQIAAGYQCSDGARTDRCNPDSGSALYGAGYALAGTSILVGAGLAISAGVAHQRREKNSRGTQCQSGNP